MIHKIMVCGALTALIFFSACNQDTNNSPAADWYVGTARYEGLAVSRTNTSTTHSIIAQDDHNSLVVFFSSFPSTSGYYKLVDEQKAGLNQLGPNECAMLINIGTTDAYLSLGLDNDSVSVDVRNNKISVNYTNVFTRFQHMDNTNFNVIDTVYCGKGALNEGS